MWTFLYVSFISLGYIFVVNKELIGGRTKLLIFIFLLFLFVFWFNLISNLKEKKRKKAIEYWYLRN